MYESYWGLEGKPFENTPDPRFLYYSKQHGEAIMRLLYVVREGKGAAILTGEFGCGKTLLSRVILKELGQEEKYQRVLILNPCLSPTGLLQEILYQMGSEDYPKGKVELIHLLNDLLLKNFTSARGTVIVIDEAQLLSKNEFEELRLLLNFQLDDKFLLTLLLIGQPELKNKLAHMEQLQQRMALQYHLGGFSQEETRNYIIHRLRIAKQTRSIFEEEAVALIYQRSQGVPRVINKICDMSLLAGFGKKTQGISYEIVKETVGSMGTLAPVV